MDNPLYDLDNDVSYEDFVIITKQIAHLETKYNSLQSQMDQISTVINTSKRVYRKKDLSPEEKAIQLHFEDTKNSPTVIDNIQKNMREIGYCIRKVPTTLLKIECSKIFNALTEEEKQKYYKS